MFVIAYVLFMLPTYFLPYAGSNSAIMHGMGTAVGTTNLNGYFWLHLTALFVLCFLCWVHGAYVGKGWLIIFPILAIVFDFVPGLGSIPMIPTVMHLLAIVLGVVGAKAITSTT